MIAVQPEIARRTADDSGGSAPPTTHNFSLSKPPPNVILWPIKHKWRDGCDILENPNAKYVHGHYPGCLDMSSFEDELVEAAKGGDTGFPATVVVARRNKIVDDGRVNQIADTLKFFYFLTSFSKAERALLTSDGPSVSSRRLRGGLKPWMPLSYTRNANSQLVPDIETIGLQGHATVMEITGVVEEAMCHFGNLHALTGFSFGSVPVLVHGLARKPRTGTSMVSIAFAGGIVAGALQQLGQFYTLHNLDRPITAVIGARDPFMSRLAQTQETVSAAFAEVGAKKAETLVEDIGHYCPFKLMLKRTGAALTKFYPS